MSRPAFPEQFNLADYFLHDRLAEGRGPHVAVRYGQRAWSYAEVAARTHQAAGALQRLVHPGERVLILLPDTPPFVWSLFATVQIGAVLAMGNPDAPTADLAYLVEYTRAAVVITLPRVAEALGDALRAPWVRGVLLVPETATGDDPEAPLPGSLHPTLAEAMHTAPAPRPARTHRDDVAVWLFTSGSTGRSKAAIHTHRDFAFNTEVYAKGTVGYRPDDVTVSVPRLYFGYATGTNLFFPFAVGATTCLFSERPTPESLYAAIERHAPTVVTNVPTMLGKLLDWDAARADRDEPPLALSSLRFSLSAGEALPEPLLQRWLARFASPVYDGIGSAEMFHIYATNRPGDVRPGSLGRAVDGYELRVLPREAEGPGAPPLPPDEIGVLWVKGDSVALGYHQDRDKSWKTFHGHWCCTGDLFRVDAEGYLWFAGRADELLKVSGLWVSPTEVEECLMQHPDVALAAVVGALDEGLLKPKAFVVPREGAGQRGDALVAELQQHVKSRLSKHKYPRWIELVDDLPKNDRGKVDRKALKSRGAAS
ncbi:MAG: benzoate-CoA ligase family protein [Polyangiaceae bacterium]|nr:benzoate-CoA ligase family protein [Polyangiaceae bacterium]